MNINGPNFKISLAMCGGLWLVLLALTGTADDRRKEASAAAERTSGRPNFVLILADDLGWKDVGYQSDGKFLTPNIDRMARTGMVFTDAYAPAGNCAPTRACLMSGYYTPRHQVYAVGNTRRGPRNLQRLIPIPNMKVLNSNFLTIAEALRKAGYATGHFGKWHLAVSGRICRGA